MRMARTAVVLLAFALSGCQLIPKKGPTHAVFDAVAPAYPNCLDDNSTRFSYRKRVAFTRLKVRNRSSMRGLYGLESRFVEALSARLDQSHYQAIPLSHEGFDTATSIDLHGKIMSREKEISNLARRYNAQFVVGGEVIDMGQQQARGQFSRVYRQNPILGIYTKDPERMIVVRLDVYEGSTGLLLDQQTFKAWSKDGADLDTQYTLMGERFMHTALGMALEGVLTQQQTYVGGLLSCIPLQAEVQRVSSLDQAVLSVGAAHGLRPGDGFKVFRSSEPSGVHDQRVGQRVIGKLVIKEVYPEHALGELVEDSATTLRQGDWVRAW